MAIKVSGTTVIDNSRNITGVSFSGSGASLTSLNASNLVSGTIPAARYATTANAYGTRTVSTGDPSGGSDGDIWYKVS